jgi:F-type H+-transporting ATPase subunit b
MNNPLVQPDPGLFIWTIVVFLVLLALLGKFAWRPLLEALDSRQAAIQKSLDEAQQARVELDRLTQDSAAIIRTARLEADSIISGSRLDAERLKEEMKQKARAESDYIVRDAQRQIQLQTGQALQQIRKEAAELSIAVATKILQRNITKEDNERLIDDALKQMDGLRH